MKVATWNVNSIRKRLPVLLDWLTNEKPDVICLQETKIQDVDFPVEAIRDAGYQAVFRGSKSFNGVATLTRETPERVVHGLSDGDDDRVLLTVVSGVPVLNTYIPQGYKVGSDKYAYKLAFFWRLRRFFDEHLNPTEPALWMGDLNVAPEPFDVYHPDRRTQDPDFHIDARNAYKRTVEWGFEDVFRRLHPDRVQYTYWDYYRKAFDHNWGWRIDHIMATAPLAARCTSADVDLEPRRVAIASDHTVMWAEFDA